MSLYNDLSRYVKHPRHRLIPGKVKSKGWMSVRAAITALIRDRSMSELLQDCLAFTGNVDTVATIALAAGSCSEEIIPDIPNHLVNGL